MTKKKFDNVKAFSDKYEVFRDTWVNNGFNAPTQETIEFSDLLAEPNASIWPSRCSR